LIKAINESNKNGLKDLANYLNENLFKYQNNNKQEIIESNVHIDNNHHSMNTLTNNIQVPTVLDDELHLIENLDDLTSLLSTDNDQGVDSTNSNQDLIFLTNDDNKLISNKSYENLFSTFDGDDVTPDPIVNLEKNINNNNQDIIDLSLAILNNSSNNLMNKSQQLILKQQLPLPNKSLLVEQPTTSHVVVVKQDDQDKKIKTLADNIIAAMPHKIKTNSYNSSINNDIEISNIDTNDILNQKSNLINPDANEHNFISRPLNYLRRNATSFDDGYSNSSNMRINSSPLISNNINNHRSSNSTSCYSSSTRSSLSPTSSTISFHLPHNQNEISSPVAPVVSVADESTCSSTFHIDSPPSTAEFCQYFHASSSSSYYKNAIETGFAQLTLTDDEQRELYEAALVIQNAYRRYIQRKKKKIRLDPIVSEQLPAPNSNNSNTLNSTGSFVSSSNHLSRSSSTSLSSLNSNHSIQSSINHNMTSLGPSTSDCIINKTSLSDDDNNSTSSEDQKQYEAACIIQKYYRRYKQFENLHKYTEAAVKIQTRYRAYKSSSKSSYQYRGGSSTHQYNKLRNYCHHNSIDEAALIDDSTKSLNEEDKRMNRSDLQLNSPASSQFQKKIARKLISHRQSPRFSPAASPLSPSPSQSNSVLNSNSNNIDSNHSNSQQLLYHHHHHHHHFHHHFHNPKNEHQDPIQIMNSNTQESNQPIYNR
jgi:hypothetical protein